MRTHPLVIVLVVLLLVCGMPLIMVSLTDSKPAQVTSAGCACASESNRQNKFLIFWKEKEQEGDKEPKVFKISDKLFDSVVDAWKTVPPNAAEVRIITVRID